MKNHVEPRSQCPCERAFPKATGHFPYLVHRTSKPNLDDNSSPKALFPICGGGRNWGFEQKCVKQKSSSHVQVCMLRMFRIETSMLCVTRIDMKPRLCVTCIDMKPSERLERVWSRQQGRRSVKGPDTFRLSSSLVGSNVRAIVSLCLARKYIYGREICLLSLGPPSLESRRSALVTRMYDSRIAAAPTWYGPRDRQTSRVFLMFRTATWLTVPVVICLSQRLSHACPSTSLTKVKPRMAH